MFTGLLSTSLIRAFSIAGPLLGAAAMATAAPYRCTDAAGRTIFSDAACVVAATQAGRAGPAKPAPKVMATPAHVAAPLPIQTAVVIPAAPAAMSIESYSYRLSGNSFDSMGWIDASCKYHGRMDKSGSCGMDLADVKKMTFSEKGGEISLTCKDGALCATESVCKKGVESNRSVARIVLAADLRPLPGNDPKVRKVEDLVKLCSGG